ncbi:MAG: hypothetical protein ACFFBC_00335 [Promethearchaeota archaeon]
MDFFEFETDQPKIEKFLTEQHVDIAYIRKDYDFAYNIIDDYGPENEIAGDDLYRFYLIEKMVKEIEVNLSNEIKVLCCGDCLHDGFYVKTMPIYTKEEIQSIFKTTNLSLIKSLVNNKVLDTIPFTEEELIELTQNLGVRIEDLLELNKFFDGYRYEPELYKVFGVEYLKVLLKMLEINPNRDEYAHYNAYGLNEFKIGLIKRRISNTLHQVESAGIYSFGDIISLIHIFFGAEGIIKFFKNTSNFKWVSKVDATNFRQSFIYHILATVVAEKRDDKKKTTQEIINTIHSILTDKVKSIIIRETTIDPIEIKTLKNILEPYQKNNQLSLISQTIASIPEKYITRLPTEWPGNIVKKILDEALKYNKI